MGSLVQVIIDSDVNGMVIYVLDHFGRVFMANCPKQAAADGERRGGPALIKRRLVAWYLASAVVIFSAASLSKALSPWTDQERRLHDPFFTFLTGQQLIFISIFLEVSLVVLIIRNFVSKPNSALWLTLWLSALLAAYRAGWAFSPPRPGAICKCFGGVGGIMGGRSDLLALIILTYLLSVGGALALLVTVSRHSGGQKPYA
jgi:hypothetical protein